MTNIFDNIENFQKAIKELENIPFQRSNNPTICVHPDVLDDIKKVSSTLFNGQNNIRISPFMDKNHIIGFNQSIPDNNNFYKTVSSIESYDQNWESNCKNCENYIYWEGENIKGAVSVVEDGVLRFYCEECEEQIFPEKELP